MICVDEKGPVVAKLYPARGQWAEASHRPHYRPDYGRRGYLWLFGALNPHTGQGYLYEGDRRDSPNFTAFMDEVAQWIPEGEVQVVIDTSPPIAVLRPCCGTLDILGSTFISCPLEPPG
jgi:hypothetical protein